MTSTVLTSSPVWTAAGWTMLHVVWVGAVMLWNRCCSSTLQSGGCRAGCGLNGSYVATGS
jgi:hypothetical protein